jgi:hypothetical protein
MCVCVSWSVIYIVLTAVCPTPSTYTYILLLLYDIGHPDRPLIEFCSAIINDYDQKLDPSTKTTRAELAAPDTATVLKERNTFVGDK